MNSKILTLIGLMLAQTAYAAPTGDVSVRGAFDFLIKIIGGLTLQGLDSIELVIIFALTFILLVIIASIILGLLWVGKKILKGVIA